MPSKKRDDKLDFKVGEKIVYPPHGVGVVENVVELEVEGIKSKFLIIRMLENEMIVKIPVDRAKKIGVRKVLGEKDLEEVLNILTSIPQIKEEHKEKVSWTIKHRKFLDKVKTGDVKVVAEVYRDLMLLSRVKDLSYGERNILEMAENMLTFEIAEAKGIPHEEARQLLRSYFVKEESVESEVEDEDESID